MALTMLLKLWFLDRMATHILAFEGDSEVVRRLSVARDTSSGTANICSHQEEGKSSQRLDSHAQGSGERFFSFTAPQQACVRQVVPPTRRDFEGLSCELPSVCSPVDM